MTISYKDNISKIIKEVRTRRSVELQNVHVHQDEVSDRHGAVHHPAPREPHRERHAAADDGVLPCVEQRKGLLADDAFLLFILAFARLYCTRYPRNNAFSYSI